VEKMHRVVSEIELVAPMSVSNKGRAAVLALHGAFYRTLMADATKETIRDGGIQAQSAVNMANRAMGQTCKSTKSAAQNSHGHGVARSRSARQGMSVQRQAMPQHASR
jgi:hypothetical protein